MLENNCIDFSFVLLQQDNKVIVEGYEHKIFSFTPTNSDELFNEISSFMKYKYIVVAWNKETNKHHIVFSDKKIKVINTFCLKSPRIPSDSFSKEILEIKEKLKESYNISFPQHNIGSIDLQFLSNAQIELDEVDATIACLSIGDYKTLWINRKDAQTIFDVLNFYHYKCLDLEKELSSLKRDIKNLCRHKC